MKEGPAALSDPPAPPRQQRPRSTRKWWRRPWIAPLTLGSIAFMAFSLPPYLGLNPSESRVPLKEGSTLHYPLLIAHIVVGTVALFACSLQLWPWFRQRYPAGHRRVGWIYVYVGAIPAAITSLPVALLSQSGLNLQVPSVIEGVLLLVCSIAGLRTARQRRFAEHRKWMIRGFALTTSIVMARVWITLCTLALSGELAVADAHERAMLLQSISGVATWLGLVVNLLVAEWWLQHRGARRAKVS